MPLEQMDFPASYEALRPVVEHEYFDHRAVPQLEEYLEEQVREMKDERERGAGCFLLGLHVHEIFDNTANGWQRLQGSVFSRECGPWKYFKSLAGMAVCIEIVRYCRERVAFLRQRKESPQEFPNSCAHNIVLKLFADARALVLPTFAGEIGHIRLRGKQSVAQALSVLPGPVPAGEGGPHAREGTYVTTGICNN